MEVKESGSVAKAVAKEKKSAAGKAESHDSSSKKLKVAPQGEPPSGEKTLKAEISSQILGASTIPSFSSASSPCLAAQSSSQGRLDLESALYKVTSLSGTNKSNEKREYLTKPAEARDDDTQQQHEGTAAVVAQWVTFRLAHTGDAATLAALYCSNRTSNANGKASSQVGNKNETTNNEEQISLWLADGLGDEDTPPSVFGLLAQVHEEEKRVEAKGDSTAATTTTSTKLGAALLLTTAWQNDQRVIRIEWYTIDVARYPTLAGHVWLRLAALSLWTDSALAWTQPVMPNYKPTLTTTNNINSMANAQSTSDLPTRKKLKSP